MNAILCCLSVVNYGGTALHASYLCAHFVAATGLCIAFLSCTLISQCNGCLVLLVWELAVLKVKPLDIPGTHLHKATVVEYTCIIVVCQTNLNLGYSPFGKLHVHSVMISFTPAKSIGSQIRVPRSFQ